jgi:hypothetical protein
MELIITLPAEVSADDIVKKVAQFRKVRAQQNARRNNTVVSIDPKLSDKDFLVADILGSIINDYREMVRAEAMRDAGKAAVEDLDKKLKTKK